MKRISEENIENLMPVADGYAYYKDFAKAIAQTQLKACEKEHDEKMQAFALNYNTILKASRLLHQKAMRDLFEEIEKVFQLKLERDEGSGDWYLEIQRESIKEYEWQALKDKFLKEE